LHKHIIPLLICLLSISIISDGQNSQSYDVIKCVLQTVSKQFTLLDTLAPYKTLTMKNLHSQVLNSTEKEEIISNNLKFQGLKLFQDSLPDQKLAPGIVFERLLTGDSMAGKQFKKYKPVLVIQGPIFFDGDSKAYISLMIMSSEGSFEDHLLEKKINVWQIIE
jgi:hypothetical protein